MGMLNTINALWHHGFSAQRWSLASLSAQQQWLVGFTAERQLSSCPSDEIGDILYCGPLGWGLLFWATKSHLLNGGGDCIHVCDACHLIPHNVTHAHGHQPGDCHHSNG